MTGAAPDRPWAEARDDADPLAAFRHRFVFADPDLIYLCGNSLGRPTKASVADIEAATRQWADHLVQGWHDELEWRDLPVRLGDLMAGPLLGAHAGEVVVS